MALMDAPASTEDHAIHLDFTQSPSCLGISAEDIAAALRDQDDDTLSAVAGRPVTKLSSIPTGVAI